MGASKSKDSTGTPKYGFSAPPPRAPLGLSESELSGPLSVFPEIRDEQLKYRAGKQQQKDYEDALNSGRYVNLDYKPAPPPQPTNIQTEPAPRSAPQPSRSPAPNPYTRPGYYQGSPELIDTSGMPYPAQQPQAAPQPTRRRFAGRFSRYER